MTRADVTMAQRLALVDAVDHLLDRGVVIAGGATLSLAGVDLVYLSLNLVLSSVETLRERGPGQPESAEGRADERRTGEPPTNAGNQPGVIPSSRQWYTDSMAKASGLAAAPAVPSAAVSAPVTTEPSVKPEGAERELARLVLTLVELLRQVLERQALRRAEGGGLSDDQVERLGQALMDLEAKMAELRALFELGEDDLNIDLGPLGQLL